MKQVNIYDQARGFIHSTGSIKHGGSLSQAIFILIAEVLSRDLNI